MWSKKRLKVIFLVFFIGAAGILFFVKNGSIDDSVIKDETVNNSYNNSTEVKESTSVTDNKSNNNCNNDSNESDKLIVHICGEIINPGVYELEADQRMIDLISKAGGFTKDAAQDYINQAEHVCDGQQVYIPSLKDVEENNLSIPLFDENNGTSYSSASETTDTSQGKININTASAEELMTITGIGKTRADSIISYRETNGEFDSIEDIMNVSGIKEGLFSKISEYITI